MATLSFSIIPTTDPDFTYTPGRAVEQWHGGNDVNVPVEGTNTQRTDYYRRWQWIEFENLTQGVYNWTAFDTAIHDAINHNQKFGFGIMTCCEGCDDTITFAGGGTASYPTYLHTLMQAEAVKDWRSNGSVPNASGVLWVANWNSNNYLTRYEALMNAIANRIATVSYTATSGPLVGQSIPYSKVIQYVDIRGYGQYGEWHSGNIVSAMANYPAGTQATSITLKRIIDAHKTAFPNYPLVTMIAAFDGAGASGIDILFNPADVGAYALSTTNTWGLLGWRKDSYGDAGSYLVSLLENNTTVNSGVTFNTQIMNRYKFAPVVGEPVGASPDHTTQIPIDVNKYHSHSFGNGNYGVTLTTAIKNAVRAASKACGYRFNLTGGTAPSTIQQSANFDIAINWQNVGLGTSYENWDVTFEIRTGATIVWTGTSSKVIKGFLPAGSASTTTDTFNFGTTVAIGTYDLYLKVKDPLNYRAPLPIAVTGRLLDGAYKLLGGLTVTVSGGTDIFTMPVFGLKTVI